jgi:hypothetical protein
VVVAIDVDGRQVKKRPLLSHLYLKVIFLPRQARDKHRENSKKAVLLQDAYCLLSVAADVRVTQIVNFPTRGGAKHKHKKSRNSTLLLPRQTKGVT